jgi:chromosome segregation ATPase
VEAEQRAVEAEQRAVEAEQRAVEAEQRCHDLELAVRRLEAQRAEQDAALPQRLAVLQQRLQETQAAGKALEGQHLRAQAAGAVRVEELEKELLDWQQSYNLLEREHDALQALQAEQEKETTQLQETLSSAMAELEAARRRHADQQQNADEASLLRLELQQAREDAQGFLQVEEELAAVSQELEALKQQRAAEATRLDAAELLEMEMEQLKEDWEEEKKRLEAQLRAFEQDMAAAAAELQEQERRYAELEAATSQRLSQSAAIPDRASSRAAPRRILAEDTSAEATRALFELLLHRLVQAEGQAQAVRGASYGPAGVLQCQVLLSMLVSLRGTLQELSKASLLSNAETLEELARIQHACSLREEALRQDVESLAHANRALQGEVRTVRLELRALEHRKQGLEQDLERLHALHAQEEDETLELQEALANLETAAVEAESLSEDRRLLLDAAHRQLRAMHAMLQVLGGDTAANGLPWLNEGRARALANPREEVEVIVSGKNQGNSPFGPL